MNSVNSNSNNSNRRKHCSKTDISTKELKKHVSDKISGSPESLHTKKQNLTKRSSMDSITPKVWSNQTSAKSEKQWRPVRPKLLKQDNLKDDSDSGKSSVTNNVAEEDRTSSVPRKTVVSNHEASKSVDKTARKPRDGVPSSLTIPRRGYRPSFSRDPKSPGFGTLRRMWDSKASESENVSVPPPSERRYGTSSDRSPSKHSRTSWRNVRRSVEKSRADSPSTGQSTLDLVAPKPFRFESISGQTSCDEQKSEIDNKIRINHESVLSHDNREIDEEKVADDLVVDDQCFDAVADGNEIVKNGTNAVLVDTESKCVDTLSAINDRIDRIDIGVYGSIEKSDTDESETEIDAICYDTQPNDAPSSMSYYSNDHSQFETHKELLASQVVEPFTGTAPMSPSYLPMASQTAVEERRYLDMSVETTVNEVDYVDQVVVPPPPPLHFEKKKREYHEIDPNVPPPPSCAPPKLPLDKRYSASPESCSDPPPLPPTNPVGRRSLINTNDPRLEVLQDLADDSGKRNAGGKSTTRLKYIEVELGQYGQFNEKSVHASPSRSKKTNYSDVVVPHGDERSHRERSNSGTSEEGLADLGNKKYMNVIQKLPPFFKKDHKPAQSKNSEEQLTDFGKERNKKKRLSERFLRKKTKDGKHKKEVQNRISHNPGAEQDPPREIDMTITHSGAFINQAHNATGNSSNSNSSGDGEVGKVSPPHNDISLVAVEANQRQKWKVLPTLNSTVNTNIDEAASYKPIPQPRRTSMYHGHAFSQKESTFLAYPNIESSTSNDDPNRHKVSSFLHGAAQTNYDRNGTNHRIPPLQPPPVPLHKRASSTPTLLSTDVDASQNRQDSHNVARVPLPGLAVHAPPNPSAPPPLLPKSQSDYGPLESIYHAADDPSHGISVSIYSAADEHSSPPQDDIPPPLPERDIYESINGSYIVPPSPMTQEEHGYKFLEAEPLYQIYRSRTLTHASSKRRNVDNGREKSHSEPAKSISEWESALQLDDLGTSTLWRSIPEVVQSGKADNMRPEDLKLQQSQFEVITSQASYLRSLNILVQHFMNDWAMCSHDILPQSDRHCLFSNIEAVRSVEQKFLRDLEDHFWKDIKLTKVCDVIAQYAKSEFKVYALYIQNQVYQDRVLLKLQRTHERFAEELFRLESSPGCNKLPLLSFLMLPMQRVTRLPLLVTAIVHAADTVGDTEIWKKAKHTLSVVNKLVKKCNDRARSMQQTEQLAEIAAQLDYSSSVKMYALISQSRSLVKKGEMNVSMATDSKKASKTSKLWLFLFSDVLLIAKKKNLIDFGTSPRFEVIDWANRQFLAVNEHAVTENAIYLVILENQAGKRVEMSLMPMAQNELSRWETALNPPKLGTAGESIYESWDCPQYTCVIPYVAQQPDELSLDVGDVMQIFKKTSDGWLEGERLRDGESGWFLASRCEEIEDEHVRSRNMKNIYKAYTAS